MHAETCPQYLLCDEADLQRPDFEGAKFVFSPPPRSAPDRAALLAALAGGVLDAVTSDHNGFLFDGHKTRGRLAPVALVSAAAVILLGVGIAIGEALRDNPRPNLTVTTTKTIVP